MYNAICLRLFTGLDYWTRILDWTSFLLLWTYSCNHLAHIYQYTVPLIIIRCKYTARVKGNILASYHLGSSNKR